MDVTRSLGRRYPLLVEEWDFDKNSIGPFEITCGSGKKVWWKCSNKKCGHEWKAFVFNRSREVNPTGCPVCGKEKQNRSLIANKIIKNGSLNNTHPDLIEEWDYEKNKKNPKEITSGSHKKVWWRCQKCGHEWQALVHNRTKKIKPRGCPVCAGKVATKNNNLAVRYPHLLEEWDYEKNGINPKEITYGSGREVWWRCSNKKCSRSWRTQVADRTGKNQRGCPSCSRGPVSKSSQKWLDFLGIKDREHYIKNLGFRVDGFDPKTNTIYEFLGDYWHGNPKIFSAEKINPTNKKSFGQLHQETLERIETLKENGYKVIYIWESDYRKNAV